MQHRKVYGVFIVLVQFVISVVNAQTIPPITTTTITTTTTLTETDFQRSSQFHIRNAYEVAKWLVKTDSRNVLLTDTQTQQLMGSLIWYANLQDESSDLYNNFFAATPLYKNINSVARKLADSLIEINKFFDLGFTQIQNLLISESTELKNEVLNLKSDYDNQFLEYQRLQKVSLDAIANCTQKINEFEKERTDLISNYDKQVEEKTSKRQAIIYDAAQRALFNQLTEEIDSLVNRKKVEDNVLVEKIRLANVEKEMIEKELSEQKEKIALLKSKTKTFLLENKKLYAFVVGLIGVRISENLQSISFQNAYDVFTAQNLPEIQRLITQAEATAAKLAIKLPSEAEMINALAIYLANRIKQESVMWFFEKITQNASNYKLLNLFFPTTIKLLQGNEVYEIPNLGAQWQYALSKDFMQMPKTVLTSDWLNKRWPASQNYASYISGVCDLAELIVKRYTYADAIKTLYLSGVQSEGKKEKKTGLQFHDYISLLYAINSEFFLIDGVGKLRMLSYEDLRGMNGKEVEMMFELLDLKYYGVFSKFIKGIKNNNNASTKLDVEKIRRLFGNISSAIGQIEKVGSEYLEEQKKFQQNGQRDWFYNTYNIWGAVNQIFAVLSSLDKTIVQEEIADDAKKVSDFGGEVFEIYNLVTKKNFSGAVINTINLIDHLFYGVKTNDSFAVSKTDFDDTTFFSTSMLKEKISKPQNNLIEKYKINAVSDSIKFKKNSPAAAVLFENERHAIQLIRKLSGFLNDAALAQNDKQLAKVVESYAMPVGSYKRKRNNWWSLDLNAFAGPYMGYEWSQRQKRDTLSFLPNRKGGVWGFSVPIGLSLSKTFGKKWFKRKTAAAAVRDLPDDFVRNPDKLKLKESNLYYRTNTTLTLTASIIDLGAIVSYRLGYSSDTTINQSLKWNQFISPGLHLALALKGSPFVVSTGVQYTPQLRKYEEAGKVNDKQFNTIRVYLGLMFDLPLFNFWERKHIVYRNKQ